MNKAAKVAVLPATIIMAFASQQAWATNGMAAHGFGTNQKAMGGAAVATNENAMNIATNPASMSFGEDNWTVGIDLFMPDRSSTIGGNKFDGNGDELFPIPEFGYQRKLNNKHSVGVAVYGNGGMNTSYSAPIYATGLAPGAVNPGNNSGIDLAQLFIAPSWSMKASEKTSVGASLNLAYQRIEVTGIGDFGGASVNPAQMTDNGYDSATGAGLSLGVQHKLSDDTTLGATYRTKTKMGKLDKYAGLFANGGEFDIPSMFTVGMSSKVSPKTTVAMDFARINYSDIDAISNQNTVATRTGALGADNGAGFGWKDQNIVKVGVKHQYSPTLALMAGYNHGASPVQEGQTSFNVLAPATVEDHITLGAEWKVSNRGKVSAQYMHAIGNEIKGDVMSPAAYAGPGAVADLDMSQNAIGIAYTSSF